MARSKRSDKEYKPVSWQQILACLCEWTTAEKVGEKCWPHLVGQGSSNGGPSSCAVAATFQLKRMEKAGLVISSGWSPTKYRAKH